MSKLEDTLASQIKMAGLAEPIREFTAIPGRKYRFDFAWPNHLLLCEVQGGTWGQGAHSSGAGISRDCEKTILAQQLGYKVFPVTSEQIRQGQALRWLQAALQEAG